jgi:hypothetical protein
MLMKLDALDKTSVSYIFIPFCSPPQYKVTQDIITLPWVLPYVDGLT